MRILTCVKDCIKNPNAHIRRCLDTNYSKQEANFPWNKTANGKWRAAGSIPYCPLSWNKKKRQAEPNVHNWPGFNHTGVKFIIWAIGNGAVKYVWAQDDVTSPHILYVHLLVIKGSFFCIKYRLFKLIAELSKALWCDILLLLLLLFFNYLKIINWYLFLLYFPTDIERERTLDTDREMANYQTKVLGQTQIHNVVITQTEHQWPL